MKCLFDKRIKELRKEKGLSQKDFALLCNVKQSCVSKWERGSTFPDILVFLKICEVLEVSSDYLLGLKDY